MSILNLFRPPKSDTISQVKEPEIPTKPRVAQGTVISIVDAENNKVGEGVIRKASDPDTISITRKTGELALPDIPVESEIHAYGCNRNTPFCLTGTVKSSTKTDLILGDIEIEERQNQRANFRVTMNEDVEIIITKENVTRLEGKIEDLSTTGACISCKEQLHVGDVIHLKALLTSRERKWRVDTDAEILRENILITKYGKTYYSYGILFPQFNEKELAKFTQWLNMYQAAARKHM